MASYKTEFANNNVDLQSILDTVNSLPEKENIDNEISTQDDLIAQIYSALDGKTAGVQLPTLTNPASASDIDSGKQAIDGSGNVINGTSTKIDTSGATATAADIVSGKTAWVNGSQITGTKVDSVAGKSLIATILWNNSSGTTINPTSYQLTNLNGYWNVATSGYSGCFAISRDGAVCGYFSNNGALYATAASRTTVGYGTQFYVYR